MKKIAFFLILSFLFQLNAQAQKLEPGYAIGDLATDFNLKNTDGKMVSLSQFEDAKGFILIFTCNTCPYSVAYEDRILELDKKFKSKGYPVIAINPNNPAKSKGDNFVLMQERAKEKKFTFPYLLDEGQKISPVYGAKKTPHVFILDKQKDQFKVSYIGAIDNNYSDASKADQKYVENAVDDLLNNKEIAVKSTKAIGCSVKL